MSKTSDSYDSLIRGVSEQTAHDRLPGQHWAQDNMSSDPVRGLARRHGSVWQDEVLVTVSDDAFTAEDLASREETTLFLHGYEYALFTRRGDVGSSSADPLYLVDKGRRKIRTVVMSDTARTVATEGIAAVTTAGKYVLLSASKRNTQVTTKDNVKPTSNSHVLWVRGGAYSRKFTVTVTAADSTQKTYTYETMKSYYDKPLDTSDIPNKKPGTEEPNPDYTKLVNDRTNAYSSAVNKHIADAAKDITPANIAAKLAAQLKVDYPGARSQGAYVIVVIEGATVTADDGGNGEFIRAASRDVTSPDMLTEKHFHGKVMIIQPKAAGSLPYYMKAESTTTARGFTDVVWRETAGVIVTPGFMFLIAELVGTTLYVAASPSSLAALAGTEVPSFTPSRCGDLDTKEIPELFGRKITYMRMFQDRLMLIAGSTTFLSKTGDYFNWFSDSMLVVKDDDPIEVFAQGTEDDTITAGVQMDRNVVLFGKRFQYIVPGREAMAPRNAYIGAVSTYEGANITAPATAGSLLFFCQRRERRLTMQQMQPGVVADRLEAFDISAQLDGYLNGTPQQIVAQTSPSVVFIKTRELRNGFYVYSFLDSNDQSQRMYDSWSRWTYDKRLGTLIGVTADDSGLLALTLRKTKAGMALVLDRFSRETDISDLPYLDSMRKGYTSTLLDAGAYTVYDRESDRYLLGAPHNDAAKLARKYPGEEQSLWSGVGYTSYVELTSPYLRDQKDRVILDAKLTVSKLTVSLTKSAAMVANITTDGGKTYKQAAHWVARAAGVWHVNTQPYEEQKTFPVPVLKDNKSYRMRLGSKGWLPLTLSVVEWAGQQFTSRR